MLGVSQMRTLFFQSTSLFSFTPRLNRLLGGAAFKQTAVHHCQPLSPALPRMSNGAFTERVHPILLGSLVPPSPMSLVAISLINKELHFKACLVWSIGSNFTIHSITSSHIFTT
jgi:hypothetical protein